MDEKVKKEQEKNEEAVKTSPYSYHTFLFPFIWKNVGNLKSIEDFEKILLNSGEFKWKVKGSESKEETISDREYYSQIQYFKKDATNILFDSNNFGVVKNYVLKCNGESNFSRTMRNSTKLSNEYYYSIKKDNVEYFLDINEINLSVYNIGVAVLSFELEYWGDKTQDGEPLKNGSRLVSDVNAINEHGRRINLPYVDKENKHDLVADEIKIKIGNFEECENFLETTKEFNQKKKSLSPHFIMDPIKNLICKKGKLTTNPKNAKCEDVVFIEPIIDDRMYVCCVLVDDEFSKKLHEKDDFGEYKIYNSDEIYKLAFIENSCSCQSNKMMPKILKRCIYDRWIDYGTIDVVTHHSFVRVTSSSPDTIHVINSFLTQYVKMAQLAVVQRATLIALENECVVSDAKKIAELQEKYVNAQKEILLDECTVQEQGIEEFNMLRRELFIKERTDSLDKRLSDLYELANLQNDKVQNRQMSRLTWAGIVFAVVQVVTTVVQIIIDLK